MIFVQDERLLLSSCRIKGQKHLGLYGPSIRSYAGGIIPGWVVIQSLNPGDQSGGVDFGIEHSTPHRRFPVDCYDHWDTIVPISSSGTEKGYS